MYSYILFDLDGTLIDSKIGITKSVQYALSFLGIEETNVYKLENFIGPPLDNSFREFYHISEDRIPYAIEKYRERYREKGLFENEVYPGITKMLEKLYSKGAKLAVASSKPTEFVIKILEYLDMAKYFSVILGSEMDGRRKEKEEVIEEVLRKLVPGWGRNQRCNECEGTEIHKKRKPDIAMVGDRKFDIMGAHFFQLTAIGVTFGYARENELIEADFIVGSAEELTKALEQNVEV